MELSDSVHFVTGGSAAHAVAGWIEHKGAGTLTELQDPLSCGPLDGFGTPEGMDRRRGWIEQVCETLGDRELWSFIETYIGLPQLKRQLDSDTSCVIWCGHQTDEQLLLRAVCAAYPERKLYLADVAAGRVKGDERCAVGACSTSDLLEVAIQPIDPLRRAELAGEWQSLIEESSLVRTFQAGMIESHNEDIFDAALISACTDTFQNAGKIVGGVLGQYPLQVGDTYLAYRLHLLISNGILTVEGGPAMYHMQARRKQGA